LVRRWRPTAAERPGVTLLEDHCQKRPIPTTIGGGATVKSSDRWRLTRKAPPGQFFEICRIGLGLGRSLLPRPKSTVAAATRPYVLRCHPRVGEGPPTAWIPAFAAMTAHGQSLVPRGRPCYGARLFLAWTRRYLRCVPCRIVLSLVILSASTAPLNLAL